MKFESLTNLTASYTSLLGSLFVFQLMFLTDPVGRASGVMFNTNVLWSTFVCTFLAIWYEDDFYCNFPAISVKFCLQLTCNDPLYFPTQAQMWCCWITSPQMAPPSRSTTGLRPGKGGAQSPLKTRWSIPKVSVIHFPLQQKIREQGKYLRLHMIHKWPKKRKEKGPGKRIVYCSLCLPKLWLMSVDFPSWKYILSPDPHRGAQISRHVRLLLGESHRERC